MLCRHASEVHDSLGVWQNTSFVGRPTTPRAKHTRFRPGTTGVRRPAASATPEEGKNLRTRQTPKALRSVLASWHSTSLVGAIVALPRLSSPRRGRSEVRTVRRLPSFAARRDTPECAAPRTRPAGEAPRGFGGLAREPPWGEIRETRTAVPPRPGRHPRTPGSTPDAIAWVCSR